MSEIDQSILNQYEVIKFQDNSVLYAHLQTNSELKSKIMDFFKEASHPQTALCLLMTFYGSDKGSGWHNYTSFYTYIVEALNINVSNLFEMGLGDVPSNMGPNGKPGASLRGWKDYFDNAHIYGADIDKRILFSEDRITTYYTDQLNSTTLLDLANNTLKDINFNLIIDDGLHRHDANTNFLNNFHHKLAPRGLFIIEDIYNSPENTSNFLRTFSSYNGCLLKIENPRNKLDNTLGIIFKE